MLVTLTAAGERLRNAAESAVAETQADILAPLDERERQLLCQLLKKVADENNSLSRVPIRQEAGI
ncbi:hypothetical protein L861_09830 [Litchfieldella anticariensis FP35 = DSM 16096]|uniref:HTH marR-type domain-containing protein n=1 Tax=Litchfieldella anticariensis (strain DSM 16096 / CECT 5854 / CIP 108499 / LMG 22089 / FP35) TaxID=1121939 RepID=S2KQ79_LITA3|nr:hypothetical protein [Halomonas anticariensis]EPC02633.1 hypothetical protein L861_09830 [Halomonas anticariensis FP35 = DSM 16096]